MADKQARYEIKANVQGTESVADLASRLDSLAKVLDGEVRTRAQAAAAELRQLGQQDQAITQFNQLKTAVNASGNALKAAETEASNFAKQIAAAGPPTAQEAAALQKLQAAATATRTTLEQQQQALSGATAELQKFGVSSKNSDQAQQRLAHQIKQVRGSVQDIAPAYQGAASSAEQSATRQVTSHRKVSEGVASVSTQLDSLKVQMLGLVGVGVGAQGIKDLAELADGYKNLEARIKLVTGEGKAFDTAFSGVFEVAKRTNSAVQETGELFTKLYEAGKPLGLLQQDALNLTETINQSIQLSGASAQASQAAIQQLVQGLQGGALRGDEFNSVMEQSPRLAKALADGLGVTTGELRKLADEGKLTSATVISSLQKQSDTIASEFGKLPATVGRAMTNLSTEFTRYVGEADKAGGYTAKLAGIIDTLANNLTTVATVMIHTGQALGAMKLLAMAQEWLAAGVAIKSTAAATELAAASTVKSTAATLANTAAQGANAAALTGAGKAAAASEVQATAFGAALKLIKGFAVLDILLNFKTYGTAIGEATAKLMGYKDRTEELARADKLAAETAQLTVKARREQAAALKEAADRSFDLGKAGTDLVAKFDEMRTKGDSASEAIGKIGKDFDLANVPGIKTAVAVLDKLLADGKITATGFQAAWSDALKGQDLAAFEAKARVAFLQVQDAAEKMRVQLQDAIARGVEGKELKALRDKADAAFAATSRSAEQLGQVLDAGLRESIRRSGLDFELISGGMGKASASAINDTEAMIKGLDRLKVMGVDTAQALTASIGKSINTAESQKALDVVKTQIEAVRKALGDKVADGLLDQAKQKAESLKKALEDATPGIQGVKEAMRLLGVTSDQTFKDTAEKSKAAYDVMRTSGLASARELAEGFKKSGEDAIAANKGVAPSWVTAEAAVRGYELQVDSAGKTTLRAAGEGTKGVDGLAGAYQKMGDAAASAGERAVSALEKQNAAQERLNAAVEKADELERKRQKVDKDGFSTDKDNKRIVMGTDVGTLTGIAAFLKSAGVDDDAAARKLALEFSDSKGNIPYIGNAGQKKYGGETMSMALLKAAETYTFGIGKGGAKSPSTIPKPEETVQQANQRQNGGTTDAGSKEGQTKYNAEQGAKSAAQSAAEEEARLAAQRNAAVVNTYTTNVTIESKTRQINTTDAASSSALQEVLRELAAARGTAAR